MAAAPLATLFTGRVLDEIACGDCEAPQQVFGLDALHSSATSGVVERSEWVVHVTARAQESRESTPQSRLHEALRAAPLGWTGNNICHALRLASAQKGVRGG